MMKAIALGVLATAAIPGFAQQTGVSNPPEVVVQQAPPEAVPVAVPAVEAIPVAKPSAATEVYGEYKPYGGAPVLKARAPKVDPDAEIVTDVPVTPGELPVATNLRVRLHETLRTDETTPGAAFTAELVEPVLTEGKVALPAGAIVNGRVTDVRGGKRIRGTALLHLQVESLQMPDGTRLPLHAEVIDTDQFAHTRVDTEGNVVRKDHVGATLAVMSLTTGGAAAAGGVIGGAPGALIGAGIGAGLSTAWWLKQDRQTELPEGTVVVLSLTAPMPVGSSVRGPAFSAMPAAVSPQTAVSQPATPAAAPYVEPQAFVPAN